MHKPAELVSRIECRGPPPLSVPVSFDILPSCHRFHPQMHLDGTVLLEPKPQQHLRFTASYSSSMRRPIALQGSALFVFVKTHSRLFAVPPCVSTLYCLTVTLAKTDICSPLESTTRTCIHPSWSIRNLCVVVGSPALCLEPEKYFLLFTSHLTIKNGIL